MYSRLLIAALVAPVAGASAQPALGPPADSYQRAAEVVRQAVEAHGGLAALRGLGAIDYTWTGVTFERYSGRDPATVDDSLPPTQPVRTRTAIDFERGRWLNEIDLSQPGGIRSAVRSVLNGREMLGYDALGYAGGATFTRDSLLPGAVAPVPFTVNLMPPVLLRQAVTREHTLRYLGLTTESGRREHVVTFVNTDGSLATIRLDDETKRLVGVANVASAPLFGDIVPTWRFSDFRRVDALLVPHAFEHHTNGVLQLRSRLTAVAVNPVLPDSLFRPPAHYVRRAPGGPPQLVDAGGGVYFVERLGEARSMFVDTEEGVVAFEAPGSPAVVERALGLVERALPGRPIRYVVLTHHHTENFGGLAAYVARGATILVPAGAEDFVRRLLARPSTFGAWTRPAADAPPRAPMTERVRGRRLIGSRARGVEVIDVGPTSHATGILVGYVPARRVLFQSDLLRINEHGDAVGTQAAADLASAIDRLGLTVDTVAGVRGRVGTMEDLRAASSAGRGVTPARPSMTPVR